MCFVNGSSIFARARLTYAYLCSSRCLCKKHRERYLQSTGINCRCCGFRYFRVRYLSAAALQIVQNAIALSEILADLPKTARVFDRLVWRVSRIMDGFLRGRFVIVISQTYHVYRIYRWYIGNLNKNRFSNTTGFGFRVSTERISALLQCFFQQRTSLPTLLGVITLRHIRFIASLLSQNHFLDFLFEFNSEKGFSVWDSPFHRWIDFLSALFSRSSAPRFDAFFEAENTFGFLETACLGSLKI